MSRSSQDYNSINDLPPLYTFFHVDWFKRKLNEFRTNKFYEEDKGGIFYPELQEDRIYHDDPKFDELICDYDSYYFEKVFIDFANYCWGFIPLVNEFNHQLQEYFDEQNNNISKRLEGNPDFLIDVADHRSTIEPEITITDTLDPFENFFKFSVPKYAPYFTNAATNLGEHYVYHFLEKEIDSITDSFLQQLRSANANAEIVLAGELNTIWFKKSLIQPYQAKIDFFKGQQVVHGLTLLLCEKICNYELFDKRSLTKCYDAHNSKKNAAEFLFNMLNSNPKQTNAYFQIDGYGQKANFYNLLYTIEETFNIYVNRELIQNQKWVLFTHKDKEDYFDAKASTKHPKILPDIQAILTT